MLTLIITQNQPISILITDFCFDLLSHYKRFTIYMKYSNQKNEHSIFVPIEFFNNLFFSSCFFALLNLGFTLSKFVTINFILMLILI